MNTVQFILTLISSAGFASVLTYIMARKKTKAEVKELEIGNVQSVVDLWQKLVEGLEKQVTSLTTEVNALRMENITLRKDIHQLEATIKTVKN